MQKVALKIVFLLALTSCFFRAGLAQVYPVQLSTQLIPPHSSYLPDYGDPTNEKLKCILVLQDFSVTHRDVKLEITITGNGYTIKTKSSFVPSPITLLPGTPQLITSVDLAPYLQTQNLDFTGINAADYELRKILPEGYYSICIRAVDYYNVNYTQVSNESCNNAWFFLNDPPFLNYPSCEAEIDPVTPQLIIFQWTAMNLNSPNSVLGTEYDFELFELRPNNGIPNNVVQNSAPVFSITTTQPFFQYSITEPTLYLGMNYVWRVRARDLSGRDLFKNEGWSQICTFTYGNINSAFADDAFTLNLQAQASTHRQGKVWWNLISNFSQYHIQVRKAGTENWFDYYSTVAELKINELEPSTTYEARVMGTGNNLESAWSNTASFTTQPLPNFNCNDQTQPINALSANPLLAATPFMIFQIGQFEMEATSISPDAGAPGYFSGMGRIRMYGLKIGVEYNHVYINDNLQITSGNVVALSEGIDAWVDNWMIDQAQEDAIFIEGNINSIYVEDSIIYVVTADGDTLPFEFPGMDHPVVINDSDGSSYLVNPDGTVTQLPSWIQHSSDTLDATEETQIIFSLADEQIYGIDNYKVLEWAEHYETILLPDSSNYFVTNKSIKKLGSDFVMAEWKSESMSINDIIFQTSAGQTLSSEIIGNKAKIRIENLSENESIYAKSGSLKLGKLNVKVFEEEEKEVIIVPLGNLSAGDITSITNTINQSFSQAVYKWNVSLGNSYTATNWDDNSNGKIDIDDYSLLNKYSDEMDKIRNGFDDSNIDKDAFILFIVPGFGDATVDGYMPYGRRYGFIKAGSNAKTFAHELGHGAFGLQHTFPDVAQNSTNNLLDYGSGNHLAGWQWEWMREGHWLENLNSNGEEIEYAPNDELSPWVVIKDSNNDFTGYAFPFLNGRVLKVKNVKKATFNRYGQLYGFLLNDDSEYRAVSTTGGSLLGFVNIDDLSKFSGKLLTEELQVELNALTIGKGFFAPSSNADKVLSYARRIEGEEYLECFCIYTWHNNTNYSVEFGGAWEIDFRVPAESLVVGCSNSTYCNVDLSDEGVISGVGTQLFLGLYKNYERNSIERDSLIALSNYFTQKIGNKKFAFYLGDDFGYYSSVGFCKEIIEYFQQKGINKIDEFKSYVPFQTDFSREFDLIFSIVNLRIDLPSNYNVNSIDYNSIEGISELHNRLHNGDLVYETFFYEMREIVNQGKYKLYEYSYRDLILRRRIFDQHSIDVVDNPWLRDVIWTHIDANERDGLGGPICDLDGYDQYYAMFATTSAYWLGCIYVAEATVAAPGAVDAPQVRMSSRLRNHAQGKIGSKPFGGALGFKKGSIVHGIEIKQVRTGSNGKVSIVGRKMEKVKIVADELISKGYDVEVFDKAYMPENTRFTIDGQNYSWSEIEADFNSFRDNYSDRRIPDSDIPQTLMYKANKNWVEKLRSENYNTLDIGNPGGERTQSVYYNMELSILF